MRIFSINGARLAEVREQQFPLESEIQHLTEANLPNRKDSLKEYVKKKISNVKADQNAILNVIDRLPDREYSSMADVEKSIGSII